MLKTILVILFPSLVFFSSGPDQSLSVPGQNASQGNTGKFEKMIVASGSVAVDLDLNRLNGAVGAKDSMLSAIRFEVERDSFFKVIVFNNELRGPLPSSMRLIPQGSPTLPGKLNTSYRQLVVESKPWGEGSDLVISDGTSGFVFFNIEGAAFDYDPNRRLFSVEAGRLLMSKDLAAELGRPSEAGTLVGNISIAAILRPIEIRQIVEGEVTRETLPASTENGTVPGPDVIVGDLVDLAQFGSQSGTQVGLAVGTDSCNAGVVDLNWFANPNNDHPVIPQNVYRMSGGPNNDQRFEQIGQSNVKHAFTALTENICGFGCNDVGGSALGSGCSDPYSASLNAGPSLGSRAWINPFSGAYPRNDSATPNNSHSGHAHAGPSHRILTEVNDLIPAMNPGATYYAEGQYITPHEYTWCQANPGQCNMNNNVSYRRYTVTTSASPFGFSPAAATVRMKSAVIAWTGAIHAEIRPDPANDGIAEIAYKVTNPSAGVWHYEYAIYNQNLDRAVQSFSVPLGNGITLSNIGFHAPPQHPGWANDGTVGNTGFSSTPWTQTLTGASMTWNSETFAQNPNGNAIRWGTLYNFRFDSNRPPEKKDATIGFFKTGGPINIAIQAPSDVAANVTVSGRVLTAAGGRGLAYAWVTLTGGGGPARLAITNSHGYYRFLNVAAGGTYSLSVSTKQRYTFTPQNLVINDNISNLDFVAQP